MKRSNIEPILLHGNLRVNTGNIFCDWYVECQKSFTGARKQIPAAKVTKRKKLFRKMSKHLPRGFRKYS